MLYEVITHGPGAPRDIENIRAQQWLTTRENQHRHTKGLQVIHDSEHLAGIQFTLEVDVRRYGIAMLASQVAASDQVPDYDRAVV